MNDADIEMAKKIRRFEFRILDDYRKGVIQGSIHLCIGQEINASFVCNKLFMDYDVVCSNHRGHGHFLAFTRDEKSLYDQIKNGKSQELRYKNCFYATGVQGGLCPVGVGIALGKKLRREQGAVVVFIGDGTFGQGVLYESLNLARWFDVPVLFVVENNHYAMSTSNGYDYDSIFQSFGFKPCNLNIADWRDMLPGYLVFDTWRFCGHSASDNGQRYKDKKLDDRYRQKDVLGGYMLERLS